MNDRWIYENIVDYISDIPKFTKKHSLDHTRKFLAALGDPQKDLKVIHVAGTNGKGSVCAYLQAMLMAEGHTAGLFTSPHLVRINERICLNAEPVSDETFTNAFVKVKETVDRMGQEGFDHPSYFEFLFGIAMVIYGEAMPDFVILETGLGGRLDATNTIEKPLACVITSISFDHTQYLGDTIESIASEKAGIIKENVPVIYDATDSRAAAVIRKRAEEMSAYAFAIREEDLQIHHVSEKEIAFSRVNGYDGGVCWTLLNSGVYQAVNSALAIRAMETIHWKMEEGCVPQDRYHLWQQALARVRWPGRMEEILPGVYVDGAHNPGAIAGFVKSLQAQNRDSHDDVLASDNAPVIMFGAVDDKDYTQMIEILCAEIEAKAYVITEVPGGRKLSAGYMKEVFLRYTDRPVYIEQDPGRALAYAKELAGEGKLYCLGSLYLVGEIKKLVKGGYANAEF